MNEQRVSDWTLGDAIERLEASGPNGTFAVGPMDKPLVLAAFRELRERRKQRCETCASFYEAGPGAWWAKADHLCSEHRDYDDRPRSVRATDGCCWHMPKEEPQPCP